ncbi:glycosyltransferase family 2 protein [Pedobacter psychrotolerans]|uniref:glycosyltransferase family 2 protein n=1 Tax=Pedobacter psychrotolerans TaxID=1843235 RepID=UPI003F98FE30
MILSVIIPCYNHGQYIQDAIDSVLTYNDQPIEIIIVDDGSTDICTINKMKELKSLGYHVIQQENSGLAKARNIGIKQATGKYILPLDADNKIKADYIRKALPLLESNECDIVYAKPFFFGEVTDDREFSSHVFVGTDLIFGNYIDACAAFKKEVWINNGGYDDKMPYQGVEDWEFWLNSYFNGFRFFFIDETLFEYRILKNSMIVEVFTQNRYEQCHQYIFNKHFTKIKENLLKINQESKFYNTDQNKPLRSVFKYLKRWITINV